MASLWYYFSVRDNSPTGLGARVTGQTPTWVLLDALDTNAPVTPQPPIVEVGQGLYKFQYDAEASGEAVGQIDALGANAGGLSLEAGDRYIDQLLTRESSRLLSAVNAQGQVVSLAPSQAFSTSGSVGSVSGSAPQTGDLFALLNPMVSNHVFTGAALANTPVGTPQTGDLFALLSPMVSNHVFTAAALSNVPFGVTQTGDLFALLNPMVSNHVFTGAALANVPVGTPQTGDLFALLSPMVSNHVFTAAALVNVPVPASPSLQQIVGGVASAVLATPTAPIANDASGRVTLQPSGLDAVQVEAGVNARQALSPILASSAGVLVGAGTGTIVVKGGNTTTTRITASTDNAGNRTAVTLSLPA